MHPKRLFIGIPLSSSLKRRLEKERSGWENMPLFLVPAENLHVSLLFLGFVDELEIEAVCEHIEDAVATIEPFELHFDAIHFAPGQEAPSMLWLRGEPSEELRELRVSLERELGYLVPEHKVFRPHVNMARVRRGRWLALENKPMLEKVVNFVEPVETLSLFETVNERGKRRYMPLCEFPLA